ncbi:hypothetical protein HUJ05_008797 [Dendroctonus ponderosae]|nr:hypothetical protein HUJ05_008797 [Dendroctonus ponderosae]
MSPNPDFPPTIDKLFNKVQELLSLLLLMKYYFELLLTSPDLYIALYSIGALKSNQVESNLVSQKALDISSLVDVSKWTLPASGLPANLTNISIVRLSPQSKLTSIPNRTHMAEHVLTKLTELHLPSPTTSASTAEDILCPKHLCKRERLVVDGSGGLEMCQTIANIHSNTGILYTTSLL